MPPTLTCRPRRDASVSESCLPATASSDGCEGDELSEDGRADIELKERRREDGDDKDVGTSGEPPDMDKAAERPEEAARKGDCWAGIPTATVSVAATFVTLSAEVGPMDRVVKAAEKAE